MGQTGNWFAMEVALQQLISNALGGGEENGVRVEMKDYGKDSDLPKSENDQESVDLDSHE